MNEPPLKVLNPTLCAKNPLVCKSVSYEHIFTAMQACS